MKSYNTILVLVFYLLFVSKESTPITALRGSGEASVKPAYWHHRQLELDNKNEIQRYLQPEELMTLSLWDYMDQVDKKYSQKDQYSRFRALVDAADRKDDLKKLTGITLLAPTNDAISREIKDFLLVSDNEEILKEIVEYHLIPWVVSYLSPEFKKNSKVTTFTVAGENIAISINQNGLHFNKHTNATAYALTNESLLYKIDRLLIPPSVNGKIPESVLLSNAKKTGDKVAADKAYEYPIVIPNGYLVEGAANTDDAEVSVSDVPSMVPSDSPSTIPSDTPSSSPSDSPSMSPSDAPSTSPSDAPSVNPTLELSTVPSDIPSMFPVEPPTDIIPTFVSEDSIGQPSSKPSEFPSTVPSDIPSSNPSSVPSSIPSDIPSSIPSNIPSTIPSMVPSAVIGDDSSIVPNFFWVFFSPGGIKRKFLP